MRDSTQHTPGRLTARGSFNIFSEDGKTPIASACLNESVAIHDEGNCRRLVAAWNACDQLDTDAIEELTKGGGVAELLALSQRGLERVRALKAQRDELVEVAADSLWVLDNMAAVLNAAGLESTLTDPRPTLRALIAKHKGSV